jgi:hypothetical protein
MSDYEEKAGDDRENLEGTYTEVNDEGPEERTVHGQYTESADFPGPETETEGSYVDADGSQEVSTEEEQGDYTESEGTGAENPKPGPRHAG